MEFKEKMRFNLIAAILTFTFFSYSLGGVIPEECASILCEFGSFCGFLLDGTVGCKNIDYCKDAVCPCDHVCVPEPKNCFQEPCPQYRCQNLSEPCIKTGCSNELCSSEENFSPCIFKAEWQCLTNSECKRGSNGTCYWHHSPSYDTCLSKIYKT